MFKMPTTPNDLHRMFGRTRMSLVEVAAIVEVTPDHLYKIMRTPGHPDATVYCLAMRGLIDATYPGGFHKQTTDRREARLAQQEQARHDSAREHPSGELDYAD